eukprot:16507-Heterococcus_DN1.PRE.2
MAAAAASEELVKLPVGVEVLKPAIEARSPDQPWTASPVVLVLLLTLVLVYTRVRRQRASSPTLELWGISYFRVVGRYEAWRVFTSSFTHLQLPHLLLNAFGLWATRRCEWKLGSVCYLATTAVFMVASQVFHLLCTHQLATRGIRAAAQSVTVGCTGVVFAWLALAACESNAAPYPVFGAAAQSTLPISALSGANI